MQQNLISIGTLPKYSNNEIYTMHWGKKKKIREMYEMLITHLVHKTFGGRVHLLGGVVSYNFIFKEKPLDCSNCAGMIKWIEDIMFREMGIRIYPQLMYRVR